VVVSARARTSQAFDTSTRVNAGLPMRRMCLLLAATAAALGLLATTPAARAATFVGTGTHPWVVVLCNFSDQPTEPYPQSYFEEMFANAGTGKLGQFDYWHDVSFGQLTISGTTVTKWVVAKNPSKLSEPLTRGQWIKLETPYSGGGGPRLDKVLACADGASGITWSNYWGVVAIFPEARSRLAAPLSASATTASLTTTTNFPNGSAPFLMSIGEGENSESVNVTAISGNTLTIERGVEKTTAKAHAEGASVGVYGDLGDVGPGQLEVPIGGKNYTIATVVLPHEIDVEGASHEMGHGFGYIHSRRLSKSTVDYQDCYDIMSAYTCPLAFSANPTSENFAPEAGTDFGGTGLYNTVLGEPEGSKGPGLNAINLDNQGWIPAPRHYAFENGKSNQSTITLHSLGDPGALSAPGTDYLEAQIPATVKIEDEAPEGKPPTNPPTCSGTGYGCTTSKYYTVEYRERSGWDRGFPASGVLLHLLGEDAHSYWVDQTPQAHGGLLLAGDEYVDAASKAYVAVNSVEPGSHTARVTLGSRKIEATLSKLAPPSGEYNDPVTLAADLTVSPSGAPVPAEPVVLSVGSQSCIGFTDATGHASCELTLNQEAGSYTLTASFAGDTAYAATTANVPFTITQEESQLTYTGATTADYHDAFTASAVLIDPEGGAPIVGKTITLTLGVGDSCSATTNGLGVAECPITPTQAAGGYSVVASFAGGADYLSSSDSKPFTITKEETTTTYTGPTVILMGGSGVTLQGKLLEDGLTPIEGRALTLSLGAQSCIGTTGKTGVAECTLTFTGPLGSEPLVASFAGDAYYLPSEDASKTATVFAFPSRGAFVLGDDTVAAALPSTPVAWWADDWSTENSLSEGFAPPAFKGFAATVALPTSTPPAPCAGPWTTRPGNSSAPPAGVPSYMGVLVSSSVTKSGNTISGNTTKIVVVKTEPGYAPDPGHHGTGTIVATYC
jgi:Bacterial Ig-like domain (group 3)